jgi:hypothetical protein
MDVVLGLLAQAIGEKAEHTARGLEVFWRVATMAYPPSDHAKSAP